MASEGFLDALAVILKVGDLILAVLNSDTLRHLRPGLNDSGNLMQDRGIYARHPSPLVVHDPQISVKGMTFYHESASGQSGNRNPQQGICWKRMTYFQVVSRGDWAEGLPYRRRWRRSSASWWALQTMHKVVTGRALSLSTPIAAAHDSHSP